MTTHFRREQLYELVLGVLALAVVPALLLEEQPEPQVRLAGMVLNWVIWLAFCLDVLLHFRRSHWRLSFIREAWLDVALVVIAPPFLAPAAIQGVRSLRLLRTLRFLRVIRVLAVASLGLKVGGRALQRSKFHYVLLVAAATVALGTAGIYVVEHGANPGIRTLDDALWWAVVTATTVGYGDVSPVTGEGRVIAVLLMLMGIGVIGIFTASLAGWLFERGDDERQTEVQARLSAIEAKLDALLKRTETSHRNGTAESSQLIDTMGDGPHNLPPTAAAASDDAL